MRFTPERPPYRSDYGAGTWKSKSVELSYLTLYASLDAALTIGVFYGKDATNHLRHYLAASGRDYSIDLEAMLREVPSAKYWYELEVDQARSFVESLPDGTYQITSRQTQSGYNREYESKNWHFAIGGYHVWGRGTAIVRPAHGGRRYELKDRASHAISSTRVRLGAGHEAGHHRLVRARRLSRARVYEVHERGRRA